MFIDEKIVIVSRDVNGKRTTILFDNEAAVLNWVQKGCLDEEDEILIVAQGNLCLYSALGADYPLSIDELTGFFA